MNIKSKLQKWLVLPVVGLILALFGVLTPVISVHAEPQNAETSETEAKSDENSTKNDKKSKKKAENNDTNDEESQTDNAKDDEKEKTDNESETTEENTEEIEEEDTCYDQIEGIGWLICPSTGVFARAIDSIYGIIEDLLVVRPLTTDSSAPIYIVWQYARDITNIVFAIMLLVVIWSHLTGVGLNNYNIKKTLPRLVIAAILVNLSFIICSLAVDVSNILGATLRGFFTNIQTSAIESGASDISVGISWNDLVATLLGGGAVAGVAIGLSGGIGAFIWMLIGAVIAGLLSVFVGLVTIALRQAVVFGLIMIAPLAFVAYLLPNTEKYFEKWKNILFSMLVFYPMFSALFGAAQLAGWALIASSGGNPFWTILGMAVQVVPLFLSVSLMKMSNTVLGTVSNKLNGLADRPRTAARDWANRNRELNRRRADVKALEGRSLTASANVRAALMRRRAKQEESLRLNEEHAKTLKAEYVDARARGQRIIGYKADGTAIYSSRVDTNRFMRENYANRQAGLRQQASHLKTDNAMNAMGDYMKKNNLKNADLTARAAQQGQNYLDYRTETSAARQNAQADERFYFNAVREASEFNANGRPKDREAYVRLVEGGAGYDALSDDQTVRENALASVTANAYTAYEKERKLNTENYGVYYSKMVTRSVLSSYENALRSNNIDAIVAAQNTLAMRGDYDKIQKYLTAYMDHSKVDVGDGIKLDFTNLKDSDYVELGSDFSNVLASNLMGMKDAAPALGRLGKAINMQTWQYTSGNRDDAKYYTMKEYVTGVDMAGHDRSRTSLKELLKGTSIKNIDRTGFAVLEGMIRQYSGNDEEYRANRDDVLSGFLPQIISALPGMETDGEQIMNTLSFMTGMKFKNGQWQADPANGGPNIEMAKKYLGALTSNDLASMKTNAFQAIAATLATEDGESAYDSAGNFNPSSDVFEAMRNSLNENTIKTTQASISLGMGGGMKNAIIEKLGFKSPEA